MPRYTADDFLHPWDREALAAVHAVPGYPQLSHAVMGVYNERLQWLSDMASKIQVGPRQLPELWELLGPVCDAFGMELPALFVGEVEGGVSSSVGEAHPSITLSSELFEHWSPDQLQVLLARECGHIICKHTALKAMGDLIMEGGSAALELEAVSKVLDTPIAKLVTTPLELAFRYWEQCSEFSADRAAAVFCAGSERMEEALFKLAGAPDEGPYTTSVEAFVNQAESYAFQVRHDVTNGVYNQVLFSQSGHELLSLRAWELRTWCAGDDFASLMEAAQLPAGAALLGPHCPFCGAAVDASWVFCQTCGKPLRRALKE